jgi:hypothetical protein
MQTMAEAVAVPMADRLARLEQHSNPVQFLVAMGTTAGLLLVTWPDQTPAAAAAGPAALDMLGLHLPRMAAMAGAVMLRIYLESPRAMRAVVAVAHVR